MFFLPGVEFNVGPTSRPALWYKGFTPLFIMLRKILLFQVLLTLMAVVPAGASTLTVFDGDDTNDYVPIYGYYCDDYLKCEFIRFIR